MAEGEFLWLLQTFQPNSDSNPDLVHEGQSCVLLFQASWHGWQLLWPPGNPNRASVVWSCSCTGWQCCSSAVCFLESVVLSPLQMLPFWSPSTPLCTGVFHRVLYKGRIVNFDAHLIENCDMAQLISFTDAAPSSPSSLSCLASG